MHILLLLKFNSKYKLENSTKSQLLPGKAHLKKKRRETQGSRQEQRGVDNRDGDQVFVFQRLLADCLCVSQWAKITMGRGLQDFSLDLGLPKGL